MNAFLEILKILRFLFILLFSLVITIAIAYWATTSFKTLHYTKQNNILLKELCVENGINVDSLINTPQNDTLNLKIDVKKEKE